MPTQMKATPRASAPIRRPVVKKPAASGGYVHFSDKMTSALMNINNVIDENKGTLDSIQDMAVELTRTIQMLRTVVMKYVDMADNILEAAVPIMEKFPIFPDKMVDFAKDALELSKKITNASELAQKVLPGIEKSLISADVSGLQASKGDMTMLTRALADMLPDKD